MEAVTLYDDYRAFLKHALEERSRKNKSLSLRSFARNCGLSASSLSRVLTGKRKLTAEVAVKLSYSLGFHANETQHLLHLVALERATKPEDRIKIVKAMSSQKKPAFTVLAEESFKVIADWYHFAILSLIKTKDFKAEPGWIAKRLGISNFEAKMGLERLVQTGLVTQEDDTYKVVDNANIETPHDIACLAVQQNHKQHMTRAQEALEQVDVELREFANITLSMNLSDIEVAKKKIRHFLDGFNNELDQADADEVFQINVQFYPTTQVKKGSL